MPYFDRFDIVEAHYLFLTHHHEGMYSDSYRRLCEIANGVLRFKPSPTLRYSTLTENGQEIYDQLVERENKRRLSAKRETSKVLATKSFHNMGKKNNAN